MCIMLVTVCISHISLSIHIYIYIYIYMYDAGCEEGCEAERETSAGQRVAYQEL